MKTRILFISGMLLTFGVRSSVAPQAAHQAVMQQAVHTAAPQQQQLLSQTISIFNATNFRVIVDYTDTKDITRKEPIDINGSASIDHKAGSPITYSVGDFTDRVFPATPDMFAGVVLTLKVPPAIQDLLTRSHVTAATSVAQNVANQSIPPRPPASAPPVPTGTNAHNPLVVPLSTPETIHYTLPGLGAPVR